MSTAPNYLCSGYMINCCFGTNHNEPESLWLLTPKGFVPYLQHTTEKRRTDEINLAANKFNVKISESTITENLHERKN